MNESSSTASQPQQEPDDTADKPPSNNSNQDGNPIEWIHGDPDIQDNIDDNVTDTTSAEHRRWRQRRNPAPQDPKEKIHGNLTVIAAVTAGVIVSIIKFAAAVITGSVAMFSEGIHSLVDASNDSLLLVGTKLSKKPPDVEHPFGYGSLVFFYTFVVSVVIFFAGGGFTVYQGITSLMEGGHVIADPWIDYIVLGLGIAVESVSLAIALRDVNRSRGDKTLSEYIRDSKNPTSFTVLMEDSAAVGGMVIAIAGIFLAQVLSCPVIDSIASIIIGLIMAGVAAVLLRETRSLLIGEGLSKEELKDIIFITEDDPAVIKCGRVLSMYTGPNEFLLNLDVTFDDELDEGDILQAIDRIEQQIMKGYPHARAIFIEAESLNQVYRQRRERKEAFAAMEEEER